MSTPNLAGQVPLDDVATVPRTMSPGANTTRWGLLVIACFLVVLFALRHQNFLSLANFETIGLNVTSIAIAGMGTAILLITGNIDLSIGGMYALIGMAVGLAAVTFGTIPAIVSGLVLGTLLGALNGWLVRLLKISPLIVTIGLMSVYAGGAYIIDSRSIFGFPSALLALGRGDIASVPIPLVIAVVVVILVGIYLTRTVGGLRLYAIGGDATAAERSGVRVGRTVLAAYAVNGTLVGLAAVLTTAQLGSASPALGVNFSFDVLTAVILGGVAFAGGAGRPIGIVIGIVTIGILNAGLVFEGLQYWWQEVAKGSILLAALGADQVSAWRRARRGTARAKKTAVQDRGATPDHASHQIVAEPLEASPPRSASDRIVFEASGVSKDYGAVTALTPIDVQLKEGEVVALLGDNGAGKSTLTKVFSGAVQPTKGELKLNGSTVDFREPADARRAGVETVYQDLALCPNLSVVHNMMLGKEPTRRVLGLAIRDDRAAAAEVRARLQTVSSRPPTPTVQVDALSGGQRQAVAIARAVGPNVHVVCFDEPTAALGVAQTANVLRLARSVADGGTSVLMVTHDVAAVKKICDRVIVLARGALVHEGPVDELSEHDLLTLMSGHGPTPQPVDEGAS